jgi:hypothetical protein
VKALLEKTAKTLKEWRATPGFAAFVQEFRKKPFVLVQQRGEGKS